jgi:hypothetical protein
MSLEEQQKLDEGTYQMDPAALNVLNTRFTHPYRALMGEDVQVKTGVLRNPGGLLLVIKGHGGRALSADERDRLVQRFAGEGVLVLGENGIPYRYGPDGRTAMLTRNIMTYAPDSAAKRVNMDAWLKFPDAKAAKRASAYIDRSAFDVQASGADLKVRFSAPFGSATDELKTFRRFANRLRGELVSLASKSSS